jgi:hypothetical protein
MVVIKNLFGGLAEQNEQFLIINKADLAINPTANNSAQSLLAAIILKASKQYIGMLTDENNAAVTDLNGNQVTFDNRSLFTQTSLTYYDRYLPTGIIRDVFEFLELVPDD